MAYDLQELIYATKEEIASLGNDTLFRSGDSGDARNAETPIKSISMTRAINKAILDILSETDYRQKRKTIALTAGTRNYTFTQSYTKVFSVSIAGSRLRKTNIQALDEREPTWRTLPNGTPRRYFLNGTTEIGLDIAPSADTTLDIVVSEVPVALAALADTPDSYPTQFFYLISIRAAWHCCKHDYANPTAKDRAQELDAAYKDRIDDMKKFLADRQGTDSDMPVVIGVQQ